MYVKGLPNRALNCAKSRATLVKADLIGLSALMTTTMVRMRDTVDLVKQRGLGVDVMVGGAVVTPAFAESIGANYSSDAVDAVRLAKSLIAARKNQ